MCPIKTVTMEVKAKCFDDRCKVWYTNHLYIEMEVSNYMMDYVAIDEWIDGAIDGKHVMPEQVVEKLHEYIVGVYDVESCKVRTYVSDNSHSPIVIST